MSAPEDAVWLAEVETTVVIFGSSTSTAVGPEVGAAAPAGGGGAGSAGGSGDATPPPDATGERRETEEGEDYDADGNVESRYRIERTVHPDRTTTHDGAHGTEHTTWFDATGAEIDDETSEF